MFSLLLFTLIEFFDNLHNFFARPTFKNSLTSNKIHHLPSCFGFCTVRNLKLIDDNPLLTPPKEVCRRGMGSVMQYLRDLDQGMIVNQSAKIIVIGDTLAGKTSLLKTLQNSTPTLEEDNNRTVGMEKYSWELNTFLGVYTFHFLDFAGQDSYVEILSLHLTQRQRSSYMLVIDSTEINGKDDKWKRRTFRWMAIALSRDSSARFTVIITKADEIKDGDVELCVSKLKSALQEFPDKWRRFINKGAENLGGKLEQVWLHKSRHPKWWEGEKSSPIVTSSKSLTGFDTLVERFEQAVTSNLVFPYVGEQIPKSYNELRQWIEHNATTFNYRITLDILYDQAYGSCYFESRKSFDSAVQYLVDMHHILVFSHAKTSDGSPLVVMKSGFLVNATKVLALHDDRNASPGSLIQQIQDKSYTLGLQFNSRDHDDFRWELKQLDKIGAVSRRLLKWLWRLVDITDDNEVDTLIKLLQVRTEK